MFFIEEPWKETSVFSGQNDKGISEIIFVE